MARVVANIEITHNPFMPRLFGLPQRPPGAACQLLFSSGRKRAYTFHAPGGPGQDPVSPLAKPLSACRVTLVSTAGIHLKSDETFDYERERREPTWGDPTHREIPKTAAQGDCLYTHLHIDTRFLTKDRNVAFPVDIFLDYERKGRIGSLADTLYSTMGYTPNFNPLVRQTVPLMAEKMRSEGVDAVFLFPV